MTRPFNRYGSLRGQPATPATRRSSYRRPLAAILVASALTGTYAFAAGPTAWDIGAVSCDSKQAMRQLAAARDTRTQARMLLGELRTSGPADARAQALSRDIEGLGFAPARYSGWRQKAVDVSDQLNGTTDPRLRSVGVRLARAGYGPTPADLLQEPPPAPGPLTNLGQALGGAADAAVGAVTSAGDAAKKAITPPPDRPQQGNTTPQRRTAPPLPKTCVDDAEPAPEPGTTQRPPAPTLEPSATPPTPAQPTATQPTTAQPTAAQPTAARPVEPTTTAQQPTQAPDTPQATTFTLPSYSATPPPGDDAGVEQDTENTGEESSSGTDSGTEPETGADSDGSSVNESTGSAGDIAQAREALDLLRELIQVLSASNDGEASDLLEPIQQAIDNGQPDAQPGTMDDPGQSQPSEDSSAGSPGTDTDDSSGAEDKPGATDPSSESSESGTSDSGTTDPGTSDSGSSESGSSESGSSESGASTDDAGWEASAEKLAEQVKQAEGDPLAQELADKLDNADVDDSAPADAPADTADSDSDTSDSDTSGSEQPAEGPSDPAEGEDVSDAGQQQEGSGDKDSPEQDATEQVGDQGGNEQQGGDGQEAPSSEAGQPSPPDDASPPEGEQPRDPAQTPPAAQGAGTDTATWDQLAECESSGDWSTDTGNGYSGGLQFAPSTWEAFGGTGDPAQASKEEQIAVAERVQDEQGWEAWPSCSRKIGLLPPQ